MDLGSRISVIGCSGSGKTWTAARLAGLLGLPHVELDAIRHGPNWTETPDDEFRRLVGEIASTDEWVIDGNYTSFVRDLVWTRATSVVWLDYARWTIMRQVIPRSVWRALSRTELWNGNREQWRFFVRPDHPIRWAWSQHAPKRVRDAAMIDEAGLSAVRLRSPAETRRWLAGIP